MAQAATGDTVKVHYTGKLEDGTVFDTSTESEPLQFKIGEGRLIPDFEKAVIGMEPGESKTINVVSNDAYGPHNKDMVMVVDRKDVPENLDPQLNQQLQIRQQDGNAFVVTVTDVSENSITLDGNHPLAGKDLIFDIQLMDIA
jgi:peptidylprolyl isomerase